ncbi:MAG TPA: lipid-binding SYLF domain-containing protein [Bryobacteraceae bacterium]|jgi:lipid-binding SYLF domain-containing protein
MINRILAFCAAAALVSSVASAANREIKVKDRLDASVDTLDDMMHASDHGIPHNLLSKARCVVVVPGMKKAGFIVGAKYGRGFAACRNANNVGWTAPAAIRIEGGSFGLQIGAAETDILLLVMNERGMKHLLTDKFTVGGDASASAGPLGREATAQTDAMMNAEILSYSRSRGLFAGISLEGATLRRDEETNRELYAKDVSNHDILNGEMKTPPAALKFERTLNRTSPRHKR